MEATVKAEQPSDEPDESSILSGYKNFQDFTQESFKMLGEAIRNSNSLPLGRDWDFHKTSDTFRLAMNNESNTILKVMNQIVQSYDMDSNIRSRVLDDRNEMIVEVNDVILDRAATNLDDMKGIRKNIPDPELQTVSAQLPVNGSWNRIENIAVTLNDQSSNAQMTSLHSIKLITAKNIIRPQSFFKIPVDNRNNQPWEPRIQYKPNSIKPLAIFLEECEDRQEYSHAYEFELDRFEPTSKQLQLEKTPDLPKPTNLTPLIEITEPKQLEDLVETLRNCQEFAVDVEHHSYRTFMGITCLLQISTNERDYIIDTLKLRDDLSILNEVFTKNTIVKIFHGADSDVEWLQRDLSIYIVNMFDTHQAAKLLGYSGLSLAYLMKRFCDVVPDKQFQLADWRIRPLPDSFKQYAREDTHYLIYIYKCLKNELLKKGNGADNFLRAVIERSTEICKKRYFKPILTEDSHMDIYRRFKKMFDNRQMYALKEIYAWRDAKAREEDESLAYVLPNHMLLHIAETLPREMQGILACCSPIPPLVRSHLLELHHIVLKAREQPLEKPIFKEETTGRGVIKSFLKINVDSPLHCPHDLTKTTEFRDDLPTLLLDESISKIVDLKPKVEKKLSRYSIFNKSKTEKAVNKHLLNYLSPYERYKLVKPFVREEEEKIAREKEKEAEEAAASENQDKAEETIEKSEGIRTDEDRIASIREHYLKMSKKFSQEQEEKVKREEEENKLQESSLIDLGGTRKRKRPSFDCVTFESVENNTSLETPAPFSKPFPKGLKSGKNKGKKRKFAEICNAEEQTNADEPNNTPNPNKNKQRRAKRQRTRAAQNINQNNQGEEQGTQNHQQNRTRKQQNQQRNNQQNQHRNQLQNKPHNQQQNQHRNQQQNHPRNQQQNQPKNWQRKGKIRQQNQKPAEFIPYDYSCVDFRQFQGGAGSANRGVQVKPKFKAKGKRKMGKGGEKSAVFPSFNKGKGNNKTK